jgi:cullin-4
MIITVIYHKSIKAFFSMEIEPFQAPEIPPKFARDQELIIQQGLERILANQTTSYEDLYNAGSNLCRLGHKDALFALIKSILAIPDLPTDLALLSEAWIDHCRKMVTFLIQTLVKNLFVHLHLWDLGLDLFRNALDMDSVTLSLIDQINRYRQSLDCDPYLISVLVKMFLDLSIYLSAFEPRLISSSRDFYSKPLVNISDHIDFCTRSIQIENSLCTELLDQATRKPLLAQVYDTLVLQHIDSLTSNGLHELIEANNITQLKSLYVLVENVNSFGLLKSHFSVFVQKQVAAVVLGDNLATIVTNLINLKIKFDNIVLQAFSDNEQFRNALKESFESSINKRQNTPAELIAKYIDKLLKTSKKSKSDIDQEMQYCLELFRMVQGKDVFEAFYAKDLAKRLLLDKSASVDAEKNMLSMLRNGILNFT